MGEIAPDRLGRGNGPRTVGAIGGMLAGAGLARSGFVAVFVSVAAIGMPGLTVPGLAVAATSVAPPALLLPIAVLVRPIAVLAIAIRLLLTRGRPRGLSVRRDGHPNQPLDVAEVRQLVMGA